MLEQLLSYMVVGLDYNSLYPSIILCSGAGYPLNCRVTAGHPLNCWVTAGYPGNDVLTMFGVDSSGSGYIATGTTFGMTTLHQ